MDTHTPTGKRIGDIGRAFEGIVHPREIREMKRRLESFFTPAWPFRDTVTRWDTATLATTLNMMPATVYVLRQALEELAAEGRITAEPHVPGHDRTWLVER
jgi:hypothetical protein